MPGRSIRWKVWLAGAVPIVLITAFAWSNQRKLDAASVLIRSVGPGEFSLKLGYARYHSACPNEYVTVEFWARWHDKPEAQGYVCGGVTSPAHLHLVPFEWGSNGAFDHG